KALESARLRLTKEHPEVRKLERAIAQLRERAAEEAKRPTPAPEKVVSPSELARVQRIRGLEADIELIDRQLAGNKEEEAKLKALIGDYQRRVDAVPRRESD